MALPSSCTIGATEGTFLGSASGRSLGTAGGRSETTFHGVHIGVSADTPASAAAYSDFILAVNGLAEAQGRPDRLPSTLFLGAPEFTVAWLVSASTGSQYQGPSMQTLLLYDMQNVSEAQIRELVALVPGLTGEMNAAVAGMRKTEADKSQRVLPYLVGGAVLALALRGLFGR